MAQVADEWVDVNQDERRAAHEFALYDFPKACLEKKATAITKGGLSIKIERFGQPVDLPEDHVRVIREDWGGIWEKELYKYAQIDGMVVVKPIPHRSAPGEAKMLLVPWNKYKLSFTCSSRDEAVMYVTYLDASYDDERPGEPRLATAVTSSSHRIQPNENNRGYPTWNGGTSSLIFIFHPPTPDGHLTSPISVMRRNLMRIDRLLDNEEFTSYWMGRPLHAYETVRDVGAPGNRDTMVSFGVGQFANADMKGERDAYRFQKNLEAQIDLMLAAKAARMGQMVSTQDKDSVRSGMNAVAAADRPDAAPTNPVAMNSPSDHRIAVPVNQHLVAGPSISAYSNMRNMWEILMPIAYACMNIPELVMNPGGSQVKGDPALAMHEWDEHIQTEQAMLNAYYAMMYSVAYYERGRAYINTFYKAWKEDTRKVVQRYGKELDARDEPFEEAEHALTTMGKTEVIDELRRGRAKLQKNAMRKAVQENIRVIFSHNHTAFVTFQGLTEAFNVDAIDEDYYTQQVGRLIGAPPDRILDAKAREKQRREKLKRKTQELGAQLETQSAFATPQPAPGGGGKGAGPKAPKLPKPPQNLIGDD